MSNLSSFIGGGGGGGAALWVSGATINKYAYVISPLDSATYQRVTATGSGTTDPADDITNYRAASFNRYTALAAGEPFAPGFVATADSFLGGTRIVPGTISIGTRTLVLNVTGRGQLAYAGYSRVDSPSAAQPTRLEIIVDGRTILDSTQTFSNYHFVTHLGGFIYSGSKLYVSEASNPVEFLRTLQIYLTPTTTAWSASSSVGVIQRAVA